MKKPNLYLLLYILVLQLLDLLTTYLALSHGARELNPLVAPTIENPIAFLAVKLATTTLVYLRVSRTRSRLLLLIYTVIMIQAIMVNLVNSLLRLLC